MPTTDEPPVDFDSSLDGFEQQLSLFWRRARALSQTLSRTLHPEMEPAAYGLLAILDTAGPLRLTDLAAQIGVGKPSVSRQIAFLERLGLVRKESDPEDGRAQRIILSDRGRSEVLELKARRRTFFREALAEWAPHELDDFARYFARLNEALGEPSTHDATPN